MCPSHQFQIRSEARFAAVALLGLLWTPALLPAQPAPAIRDPVGEFVQLTVAIEILPFGGGWSGNEILPWRREDGAHSRACELKLVVGRDKWLISRRSSGQTNEYTFDGTRIVERTWVNRAASASDSDSPNATGRWWTRSFESPDGNPSQTVRVSDHLDMVSRIAWLAFCSAPTLNHPSHKLYPPWDFWKEYLDPNTFVEKVTRFEDDLGVPRRLLIFSGEHQPVVDYRVSASTNVAGWSFPEEFYVLEYNPTGAKGWMLALLAHGRVSSIAPAVDPLPANTTALPPQRHNSRFAAASPSRLHLEGTSDVHDWSLETSNVVGFIELNQPLFGPSSAQTSLPQPHHLQASAEFYFPVRHFSSGYSAPMFSEKADQEVLHHALKTTGNPNIVYRLRHLVTTNALPAEPATLFLQSTGDLVIGGVTNPISLPVRVTRQRDALQLSGSTSIRLSDFDIQAPSVQGRDWAVKVGNAVDCSFEIVLENTRSE